MRIVKTVTGYVNVYPNFTGGGIYQTAEEADNHAALSDRVACVRVVGTYETEIGGAQHAGK